MRVWWLLPVLVGAVGCGGGFKPESYPAPADLYAASKAEYQRGKCGNAVRGFTKLLYELPTRDPRTAEVRFLMAECRFKTREYLEASRDFRRVSDEYPESDLAPSALLRAGDALAKIWKRPELDPTYGEQAMSTYSELLTRYPNAPEAGAAQQRSLALADRFAQKDLKNGEFYFRIKAYDSAIIYYRSVVASYPQSKYAPTALMRLVETYRRIGYDDEATETCAHLRQYYADADGLSHVCPAPAAP